MVIPITITLQCTCKYLQHLEILVSKLVPVLPIRCTPTLTCITSTLTSYKYYQYADMDIAFSDMCLRVCSELQIPAPSYFLHCINEVSLFIYGIAKSSASRPPALQICRVSDATLTRLCSTTRNVSISLFIRSHSTQAVQHCSCHGQLHV